MLGVIAEGFFALFAAIGSVTVVWMIVGVFMKPKGCKGVCTYTVVAAKDENSDVRGALETLLWWQDMVPEEREVILCGKFDNATAADMARIGRRCARFTVLEPCRLGEYLERQLEMKAAGDEDGEGSNTAGGHSRYGDIPE